MTWTPGKIADLLDRYLWSSLLTSRPGDYDGIAALLNQEDLLPSIRAIERVQWDRQGRFGFKADDEALEEWRSNVGVVLYPWVQDIVLSQRDDLDRWITLRDDLSITGKQALVNEKEWRRYREEYPEAISEHPVWRTEDIGKREHELKRLAHDVARGTLLNEERIRLLSALRDRPPERKNPGRRGMRAKTRRRMELAVDLLSSDGKLRQGGKQELHDALATHLEDPETGDLVRVLDKQAGIASDSKHVANSARLEAYEKLLA